jgi:uncharacterized protein (TIGR02466 family)
MDDGNLHYWFPTPLYIADDILLHRLSYYEGHIKAIKTVKNSLISVDSTWEVNNQLHLSPDFTDLTDEIYGHARYFLAKMGYDDNTISKIKMNNMWANVSHVNDYLFPHVHANSFIAGAFYVKSFEGSKIKFFNNLTNMLPRPSRFNRMNVDYCEYDCNPGRLVLFKSDTLHGTTRQLGDEKIVISFNIGVNY